MAGQSPEDHIYTIKPLFGNKEETRGIRAYLTPKEIARCGKEEPFIGVIGYIPPERIVDYFCKNCNATYEDKPTVEANIEVNSKGKINGASLAYFCSHCHEVIDGNLVFDNLVLIRQFPPEIIKLDRSGELKKPTLGSIEALLEDISQEADLGNGSFETPSYADKKEVLERWSKKINYDLDWKRLDEIDSRRRVAYLQRYQNSLPERLEVILTEKEPFFDLSEVEDCGFSWYEGELSEEVEELLVVLPYLSENQDLNVKEKLSRVLDAYIKMYDNQLKEDKKELENLQTLIAHRSGKMELVRGLASKFK